MPICINMNERKEVWSSTLLRLLYDPFTQILGMNVSAGTVLAVAPELGSGILRWGLEPVSDRGFRLDESRVSGVGFNLLTELVDDNPEIVKVPITPWTPERMREIPMRYRLALVGDEMLEQMEFLGAQMDSAAANGNLSALKVNGDIAASEG